MSKNTLVSTNIGGRVRRGTVVVSHDAPIAWSQSAHATSTSCLVTVIDLLLILTRATQPADKQGPKACARAVLPHSILLGAMR